MPPWTDLEKAAPNRLHASGALDRLPCDAVADSGAVIVRLLLVLLWLSFIYASYNGAMVVTLTEIMPVDVRTSGFSLAYSLATALLGGFTPALCTYLIHITGNRAAPGLWMSFAAVLGLIAALVIPRPENALEDVGLTRQNA